MDAPKIGTWPTPERPLDIRIPTDLAREFGEELRIIVGPWPQGLVMVPHQILDRELAASIRDRFEVVLVPKERL